MVELRGAGRLIHRGISSDRPELTTLISLIDSLETPEDQEEYHTWFSPLKLTPQSESHPALTEIVDYFMQETQGNRKEPHKSNLRRHWELVLLNLAIAVFQRRWLLVPLDNRAFKQGSILQQQGLSHGAMQTVIKHLNNQHWIKLHKGKLYAGRAKRSRVFPEKQLATHLYPLFLDIEQPFNPPYLVVGEPSEQWSSVVGELPEDHPEMEGMLAINEFLESHSWACKAPVVLRYKKDFLNEGRLYTPYQNLPDKRARIRMNTLIDGEPLCEVDFSANHLRLQLAVLAEQDAGEGPYEDICMEAQIFDRDKVKSFITVAMGANDRANAANSLRRNGVTTKEFEVLEAATLKRFPDASLFTAWTHQAQNLEGQILKRVLLQGIEKGVVCLPVHDAVAVQQQHADWAKEAMSDAWEEEVGMGVRPRLKVDYP